ncbi:MAG: hypothetical protein GXP33_11290 [Spirochaetes bacterium]|nr:hypothetical protein [Spirochaetota bacterium]
MKIRRKIIFLILGIMLSAVSRSYAQENDPFAAFLGEKDSSKMNADMQEDVNKIVTVKSIRFNLYKGISPEWIGSLLFFKKNRQYRLGELRKLIEKSKRRLVSMNMFYKVNLYLWPKDRGSDQQTVVVEVSEGFWYRFFFYPWAVSVEFLQLFHEGKYLGLNIGYPAQSISYRDGHLLLSDVYLSMELFHGMYDYNEFLLDRAEFSLNPGYHFSEFFLATLPLKLTYYSFPQSSIFYPEFKTALSEQQKNDYGIENSKSYLTFGPSFELDLNKEYIPKPVGFYLGFAFYYHYADFNPSRSFWEYVLKPEIYIYPNKNMLLSIRGRYKYQSENAYPYMKYSLYSDFRGYASKYLGEQYAVVNIDYSLRNLFIINLNMMHIEFKPFIYTDLGQIQAYNEAFSLPGTAVGFGGGVHLYFSMPVNIYFTFGLKASYLPDGIHAGFLFSSGTGKGYF